MVGGRVDLLGFFFGGSVIFSGGGSFEIRCRREKSKE